MAYVISLVDIVSIFAAGLVLATFALPRRIWLCGLAVLCNAMFVGYGLYLNLLPVWLLHLVVLGLQFLRFDLGGYPRNTTT
jgi:hypothetical protein